MGMKRFFAILICTALIFACIPAIPVSAADDIIGTYTKVYKADSDAEKKLGVRVVTGTCTGKEEDIFNDSGDYNDDLDVFRLKLEKDCTTEEFPHYEYSSVEIDLNGHTWTVTDTSTYELQHGDISISGGTLIFTGKDSHPLYTYTGTISIRNVIFKDCVCGSYGIILAKCDPGGFSFGPQRPVIPCSVYLDNVTFENCSSTSYGSCVTIETKQGKDHQFNNCKFNNCHSKNGGAVYIEYEGATDEDDACVYNFVNCEFNDCYATSDGGAIYIENRYSTLNFKNCTAYHCNAGGDGGFAFISGEHTVCNGNGTSETSTLSDRSNIVGCYALDDGGAFYSSYASGNSNYSEIKNFNMVSNTAGASSHNYSTVRANDEDTAGGAVYMGGHDMKVSFCDFYDNYADEEGGAIYCGWHDSTIENCSFAENQCEEGNDIYVDSSNNISVNGCTFYTSGNSIAGDEIKNYIGNYSGPAKKDNSAFAGNMIEDGDYIIYSAVASTRMCLDINCDSGGKSNGDNLQYYTTSRAWANVFTIKADTNGRYIIKSKYSGLVLDIEGESKDNGANIYQYKDLGGDNQRWYFDPTGDGYFYIRSGLGTYMDVAGGGAYDGCNIYSWSFNGGNNQKFWLQRVMEEGDYIFYTALDEKYAVDIENGKQSAGKGGANIFLWQNGEANVFTVTKSGGPGQHTVKSKATGMVWGISGGSSANGTNIVQWANTNVDNQRWSFEPTGDGYYYIRSGLGTYMDVPGDVKQPYNGCNIRSWAFSGVTCQKFKIVKASNKSAVNPNGDGSKENPYKISTAGQWKTFATNVRLGETYEGKYIELTDDISVAYIPVGYFNQKKAFKGHFNGNNHTVRILDCSENWDRGLFSFCVDAEIKNIRVTGKIRGTVTLAGICAAAENTTFENCVNDADISSINDDYIAGICGITSGGKYISCTNNGTIYSAIAEAGGIVARCAGGNPEFIDCRNNGTVSAATHRVGGIVGYSAANVTIKRCVNNAQLKGSSCLGGMIGYLENGAGIFSCINTDKGNMDCVAYAAGMIGNVASSNGAVRICNCANFGKMNVTNGYCAGIVVNFENNNLTAVNCFNGHKALLYIYNCGAITAGAGKGSYTNCYCIDGTVTDAHATTLSAANCKDMLANKMNTYIREHTTSKERADWLYWSVNPKTACAEPSLSDYTDRVVSGSGTKDDPYLISNAKHLEELANDLRHGIDHKGSYFKITQSFTYIGSPIGAAGVDFAGNLDGDYHTLTVQITSGDGCGLFCAVRGGSVKNLSVAGSVKGAAVVGGIAGHPYQGAVIDNCHVTATVTGTGTNVGGVAGSTGDCTISNCRVDGNVSSIGWTSIGGIAGSTWGNCSIVNCVCASTVTGDTAVGGIVGVAMDYTTRIINCASLGATAETTKGGGNKHGGFIGCIEEDVDSIAILNCFSMCNVGGSTNRGYFVGSNDGNKEIEYYTEKKDNKAVITDFYVKTVSISDLVGTDKSGVKTLEASFRSELNLSSTATTMSTFASGKKEANVPLSSWVYDSVNKIIYPNSYSYADGVIKGSGTENDPYRIVTAEHLIQLANNVASGEKYKGKYFRLTRSFVYDGPPIGAAGKDFCGAFDGDDHKLTVSITSTSDCTGLFAQLNGATVKDLEVAGAISGTSNVGGIVGHAHHGSVIYNCLVSATVKGTAENVGGIAGAAHNSIISNCRVDNTVTGIKSVGGIAGWFHTSSTVVNCLVTKKVTGTSNVGGIVGLAQHGDIIIANCSNHADLGVTKNAKGNCFGGIVGSIGNSVTSVTIGGCVFNCKKADAANLFGNIIGNSDAPASVIKTESLYYGSKTDSLPACGNLEIAATKITGTTKTAFDRIASTLSKYARKQPFDGIALTTWKYDGTHLAPKNYTNRLAFAASVFGATGSAVLIVICVVSAALITAAALLYVRKKKKVIVINEE